MGLLREALSVFSLLNAAFWAAMAGVWRWQPRWAERLPFELATHERYRQAAAAWARLAGAMAGFWSVAALLYLVGSRDTAPAVVIALFGGACAFLVLGVLSAGSVYRNLQPPKLPSSTQTGQ